MLVGAGLLFCCNKTGVYDIPGIYFRSRPIEFVDEREQNTKKNFLAYRPYFMGYQLGSTVHRKTHTTGTRIFRYFYY